MADFDPRWGDSIAGIESGGASNPYTSVTPSPGGRQALGKYQVMAENVPEWTQAALGSPLTPQQFLSNPDAQEAVFKHRFGGYVDKYGSPQDAASAWFTGRPINDASSNAHDSLGTSGADYVRKFNDGLDGPTAIQHAMHIHQGGNSPMAFADPNDPNNAGALSTPSTIGPGVLAPGSAANGGGLENGLYGAAAALASIYNPAQGQVLNSMRTAKNGQYTMSSLPDGTLVRINNQTGQVEKMPGNYAKDERKFGIISDKNGNKTYGWSPTPERWDATHQNGATPAEETDDTSSLTGSDFMDRLTKDRGAGYANSVQAVIDGRGLLPHAGSRAPGAQQLRQDVFQADPTFQEGTGPARVKLRQAYETSTAPNSPAVQIRMGNTTLDHHGNLSDELEAMKAYNDHADNPIPGVSYALNMAHNKTLAGSSSPEAQAYRALQTHIENFANEKGKYLGGGVAGEHEKQRILELYDLNKSLPELRAGIAADAEDVMAKGRELQNGWRNGNDNSPLVKDFPVISKEGQAGYDRVIARHNKTKNGGYVQPSNNGSAAPVAPPQPNTAQSRKTSNGVTWSF